jgi:hypothetical protein
MKHFFHHLFLPRHSNKHRPKVLHYEVLFIVIAFLLSGLLFIGGLERQYPAVLGDATSISVQDLLTYTNMKRQANGLAPVKLNKNLTTAANQKAKHMFAQNYWAHVAPDGTTPWVFIKDSGYQYLYAGENLARGFTSGSEVVEAWMDSPTHRENMLSPNYTDIGFAILPGSLTGSDTVLVVQMFGSPYAPNDQEPEQIAAAPIVPTVPASLAPSRPSTSVPLSPQVSATPAATLMPTPTTVIAVANDSDEQNAFAGVAAVQSKPLLDTGTVKRNTSFILLFFFMFILILDAIIVERNNISRAFSHNIDHILFLAFILIAGIIIGKGAIL